MSAHLHYNARVALADGSSEKIGKLANQGRAVRIWAQKGGTGNLEVARVTRWHRSGPVSQFLQLEVERVGGSGVSSLGLHPDRLIQGVHGPIRASDLRPGMQVFVHAVHILSPLQRTVALASVLGDGSLCRTGRHTVQLRVGHSGKQMEYAQWKASLFGTLVSWSGSGQDARGQPTWGFAVQPTQELLSAQQEAYGTGAHRTLSPTVVRELNLHGVALWYMDDGTFSGSYARWGHGKSTITCRSYSPEEIQQLADRMVDLGLPRPTVSGKWGHILWSGVRSKNFQEALAPYLHPSMAYKVHPRLHPNLIAYAPEITPARPVLVPAEVLSVKAKPPTRSTYQFDLFVDGRSGFLVDGVAVPSGKF